MIEAVQFPHDKHGEFLYVGRFCSSSDIIAAGGSGTNDLKVINRNAHKVWEMNLLLGMGGWGSEITSGLRGLV